MTNFSPAPLVTLPMVPEVLTKVHSAQFPGFLFLKWRIAMPLIIERSLSIVNSLCKVADSDYQVSKRSILDSAGKGRLSLKKNFSQALLVSVWPKNKEGAWAPGPIPKINRNSSMFIPSVQTVWSSDRVLPLSMRYASLSLRRDMLK